MCCLLLALQLLTFQHMPQSHQHGHLSALQGKTYTDNGETVMYR